MRAIAFLLFLTPLLHAPACAAPQTVAEPAAAPVAKPRPARTRIAFSERGELIVDGERRFIRAGHRSGQTDGFTNALKSAADAGFNMVHDYRFESIDIAKEGVDRYVEDARAYLRKANQLGLGVYLGLPRTAVKAADEKTITAIVNALAGERALWMWYIYDEPRPEVLSVESASRVYKLLKRLDPERPAIMLTNKSSTMQQYRAYCDILWFDRYPIAATSIEKSSLKPIAEALDTAMKAGPVSEKPVWPVLQAQDNKGSPTLRKKRPDLQRPDDRTHRPNEAELRAAAHVAIARGAPAVAYYWAPESWYSMKTDTPGIWASLGRVLRELESLEAGSAGRRGVATGRPLGGIRRGSHLVADARRANLYRFRQSGHQQARPSASAQVRCGRPLPQGAGRRHDRCPAIAAPASGWGLPASS